MNSPRRPWITLIGVAVALLAIQILAAWVAGSSPTTVSLAAALAGMVVLTIITAIWRVAYTTVLSVLLTYGVASALAVASLADKSAEYPQSEFRVGVALAVLVLILFIGPLAFLLAMVVGGRRRRHRPRWG